MVRLVAAEAEGGDERRAASLTAKQSISKPSVVRCIRRVAQNSAPCRRKRAYKGQKWTRETLFVEIKLHTYEQ